MTPSKPLPFANGSNGHGRDARGRFAKGNRAATGHGGPYSARVAELLHAVTAEDLADVLRRLVSAGKAGDAAAARLVLQYAGGQTAGN